MSEEAFDSGAVTPHGLRMVVEAHRSAEALWQRYEEVLPTCFSRWISQVQDVLVDFGEEIGDIVEEAYDDHGELFEDDRDEIGSALLDARDIH